MGKSIFQSKTFYVNVIAVLAMVIQGVTGKQLLGLETQAVILSVINIILRTVTKDPISWE